MNFRQGKELLFKKFDFNKRCKNEIEDNNEKYAVDSAIQLRSISILRTMVLIEIIRQRGR